jgi:predicted HAD superfamily Cof-like phosphohydrolase
MSVGAGRWPTSFERALAFHRALDLPVGDRPGNITQRRRRLRLTLLGEEVAEFVAAMVNLDDAATETLKDDIVRRFLHAETSGYRVGVDMAHVAKEACDVHVVTSGALVEYGIDEDAAYDVVHASNMAKAGGPTRADGKHLKPEGWRPPDVAAAIGWTASA